MLIEGVIWLRDIVDKLAVKHQEKGGRKGEDVYLALAKLTPADIWPCGSYTRSRVKR